MPCTTTVRGFGVQTDNKQMRSLKTRLGAHYFKAIKLKEIGYVPTTPAQYKRLDRLNKLRDYLGE